MYVHVIAKTPLLPKIRRQRVFQVVSVPGAETNLGSVCPLGLTVIFSVTTDRNRMVRTPPRCGVGLSFRALILTWPRAETGLQEFRAVWSSHTKMVSVITRGVSREASSSFFPLSSHTGVCKINTRPRR